ncbi:MAG: hypothetical protein MJK04_10500 [Psychrosphaera sp.]|nr:hypothetical protein [Psychrosphaera sp.]
MRNSYFPEVLYSEAGPELRAIYDETMAYFGLDFVLNYFKAQGSNITMLKCNWEKIKSIYFCGTVSRIIKEEIIYRISKRQECNYCSYVHARMIDDLQAQIRRLKGEGVQATLTHREEEAVELVTQMALVPSANPQGDCDLLVTLGFSAQQVPELLGMAELTIMFNMQAQLFGIEIDEEILRV